MSLLLALALGALAVVAPPSWANTALVKDIKPGNSSSFPSYLTNVSGKLLFQATDASHGAELWKSDGTLAGTKLVKDIKPGGAGSFPSWLTTFNGKLFFSAFDSHGVELWKSDGTP
jgi:ELWxxDGT repeat protein